MKYVDGFNYLDQLKNYVHTSHPIRDNLQPAAIERNVKLEDNDEGSTDTKEAIETKVPIDTGNY